MRKSADIQLKDTFYVSLSHVHINTIHSQWIKVFERIFKNLFFSIFNRYFNFILHNILNFSYLEMYAFFFTQLLLIFSKAIVISIECIYF